MSTASVANPFTQTDEIRARGVSVEFKCEKCIDLRSMDDLHRIQIDGLNGKLSACEVRDAERVAEIRKLVDHRQIYRLVVFAVSVVAVMALASDAGWFK